MKTKVFFFIALVVSMFIFSTTTNAQFRKAYECDIQVDQYDPITIQQVLENCANYKIDTSRYGQLFMMAGQSLQVGDTLKAVVYAFKGKENSYRKAYRFSQRKEKKGGFLPGLQGVEIMKNHTPVGLHTARVVGFGDPESNDVPCLVYSRNAITKIAMFGQDGQWRKGYYFLLLYK